jgi:hypothetical protein
MNGLVVPYTNFTETAALRRPADAWLAAQLPGSALVEYPWLGRSKLALYSQTLHSQPIVNGYAPHLPEFLAGNPAVTQTWPTQESVEKLKSWGVRYILLTRPVTELGQDEIFDSVRDLDYLCLVESFPQGPGNEDGWTHVIEIVDVAVCPED